MKLTEKLVDYLYRSFSKDPERFLALRIRSAGSLSWSISDGVLSVTTLLGVTTVALADHTLSSLAGLLSSTPGVTVEYLAGDSHLSARVLLDGGANQNDSNGDHLYGYGSLLWAYMEPISVELVEAENQIVNMIDQMSITSADAEWLDEWGGYFGISRSSGESDSAYANRMIIEITRPRANNKAIEIAIKDQFGQVATVTDIRSWGIVSPTYNGAYLNNGVGFHNGNTLPIYGLFQVVVGYDLLNGGSQAAFSTEVSALIEKFRAAGTHLDSLSLAGALIADVSPSKPTDAGSITVTTNAFFDGTFLHDGSATYVGTAISTDVLS